MKIDGACHCGRVSFEAEVDPAMVVVCHCTDCQALSGSPYRVLIQASAEAFSLRGEPRVYVKTAASGNPRAQAFCPDCGAAIYAAATKDPKVYNLRLGVIRQRGELGPPARQVWCDSALPWAQDLRDVPRVSGQS